MISSNWDEFPDYGNAGIPAPEQKAAPKKEEKKGSFFGNIGKGISDTATHFVTGKVPVEEPAQEAVQEEVDWETLPDYGNANMPAEEADKEGTIKSGLRTGAQIPLGVLNATPIPLAADAIQLLGYAEALQGLEDLKEQGIPVDEAKYMKAVQEAMGMFPSQRNIEKAIEHHTGIPLEPKTLEQEGIRLTSGLMKNMFSGIASKSTYANQSLRPPQLVKGQRATIPPAPPGGAAPPPPGAPPPSVAIGEDLIGTGATRSYQDHESAINYIKGIEAPAQGAAQQPPVASTAQRVPIPIAGPRPPQANLQGRVNRTSAQARGVEIQAAPPRNATPQERVEGLFPARITNSTEAGESALQNIRARADATREVHTELYQLADELTPLIAEPRYDILIGFERRIAELNRVHPSASQQQLIGEMRGVIDKMSVRDAAGNFVLDEAGQRVLQPWTNKQVLDQIKAFRQNVDASFMPGNPGNEYMPLIQELSESAAIAAEIANAPEAAQAIRAADNSYRTWSRVYNNNYIKGLRDPDNIFPNRSYQSLLDKDNFAIASEILQETQEGRELIVGLQRKIVNDKLEPFYNNRNFSVRKLDDALLELQPVISREQAATIKQDLMHREPRMPQRGTQIQTPEQVERAVSKYLGMDPEDLRRSMNNVSDMRRIRERLDGTNHFENLIKHKTRDIVYKGNLEAAPTGEELYNTLNKSKNAELLIEMHGEQTYNELLAGAKAARDAELAAVQAEKATKQAARTAAEQEALSRQIRKDKFKKYKTAAKVMAYIGLL